MTWKGVTVKSVCEHKKWGAGPLTREKSDFSHRLSLDRVKSWLLE